MAYCAPRVDSPPTEWLWRSARRTPVGSPAAEHCDNHAPVSRVGKGEPSGVEGAAERRVRVPSEDRPRTSDPSPVPKDVRRCR